MAKVIRKKGRENWQCNFCDKEKDTLYFVGRGKQICEECREKARRNNGHSG